MAVIIGAKGPTNEYEEEDEKQRTAAMLIESPVIEFQ